MDKRILKLLMVCICAAVPMPALAQAACTRADLQSVVDAYLSAQRSGNPSSLPLTTASKYVENTEGTPLNKGILASALKIDFSRSLLDTAICETFTEVIVTDKSHMKLTNRRFIADPEIGAVVGFIRWPTTVPDSHLFRVENGKLRFVHSLTVCTVPNCGFPQRAPAAGR